MKYVAGLLFDESEQRVALILKDHGPDAVVGKWNAIGGKVNEGETSLDAMRREFTEEAGVVTNWEPFLVLEGTGWQVDFFHQFNSVALAEVRTTERESVMVWNIDELPVIVPNLNWIIPMALGHKNDHVQVYEVIEAKPLAA